MALIPPAFNRFVINSLNSLRASDTAFHSWESYFRSFVGKISHAEESKVEKTAHANNKINKAGKRRIAGFIDLKKFFNAFIAFIVTEDYLLCNVFYALLKREVKYESAAPSARQTKLATAISAPPKELTPGNIAKKEPQIRPKITA